MSPAHPTHAETRQVEKTVLESRTTRPMDTRLRGNPAAGRSLTGAVAAATPAETRAVGVARRAAARLARSPDARVSSGRHTVTSLTYTSEFNHESKFVSSGPNVNDKRTSRTVTHAPETTQKHMYVHGGYQADLAAWWALWRHDIRDRSRPKAVRIKRERQMSFRQRLRVSSHLE